MNQYLISNLWAIKKGRHVSYNRCRTARCSENINTNQTLSNSKSHKVYVEIDMVKSLLSTPTRKSLSLQKASPQQDSNLFCTLSNKREDKSSVSPNTPTLKVHLSPNARQKWQEISSVPGSTKMCNMLRSLRLKFEPKRLVSYDINIAKSVNLSAL
jgi:hypothetical protein